MNVRTQFYLTVSLRQLKKIFKLWFSFTKGDRLKLKREKADYENNVQGINNLTTAAIQDAEFIIDTLKKWKTKPSYLPGKRA